MVPTSVSLTQPRQLGLDSRRRRPLLAARGGTENGKHRLLLFAGAAATALVLAGCSSGQALEFPSVIGVDDAFVPPTFEVATGHTVERRMVEWKTLGDTPHKRVRLQRRLGVRARDGTRRQLPAVLRGARRLSVPLHVGTPEGDGMAGYVIVGDVPDYELAVATPDETVATWSGTERTVPDDYATIQAAVDAAEPGNLVTIEPGIYEEAAVVRVSSQVVRGADRNTTILEGASNARTASR